MEQSKDRELVREHLANERTYLAWTRTGIGIMAFGFVVVKFSLFVKQIALSLGTDTIPQKGYSAMIGIFLVVAGALTSLLSFIRYRRNMKLIREQQFQYSPFLVSVLTVVIVTFSIALVAYLVQAVK